MRVTREGDNVPVLDIQGRVAIPRQAFENWWRAEMARKKAKNETYPNCATATAFLLKYLTADDRDLLCGKESRRSVNIIGGVVEDSVASSWLLAFLFSCITWHGLLRMQVPRSVQPFGSELPGFLQVRVYVYGRWKIVFPQLG
jgi:hypothetical protein